MEFHIKLPGFIVLLSCLIFSDALEQPFFTSHPMGTTVINSNRHTISCQATGTTPIDYGWEINDVLIPAWTSSSYTFTQIGKSNIGVYRCVGSNAVGSVISRGAELHVAYFEEYDGDPQTTTVDAGKFKILTCPPYDSYPIPTVTWQFNGGDITPGQDQLVTADQRLVVLQASDQHQGPYTCKAHNTVYGDTQISPSVTLTVQGAFTPPPFIAPTVVVPPSDTVVRPGQSFVQMECIISAHPLSSLRISWQKDRVALADTGAILKIFNPTEVHAGTYLCIGNLEGTFLPAAEASANLTMYIAPVITSPLERITQEAAGSTLTIPCTAIGVPAPQIKWYINATDIATITDHNRFRMEDDGSLKLTNLGKTDSGMFQCQAINAVGEQIVDTWLQVQEIAPEITLAPIDTTILEGETTFLECAAEGAPNPTIYWEKDGVLVLSEGFRMNDRLILQTFGNLLLQQAVKEDSGVYTCIATNTLDTTNSSASLTVYQRTFISQRPSNVQTILGETTTLTCVVQHDQRVNPTVTWTQDGGVIVPSGRFVVQDSGSLVIQSTDALDMGLYVCRVTSIAGEDHGSANLTVLQVPYTPQGVTAAKKVDQARTIVVSWLPVFDGNSPLIRYILEQKEDDSAFTEVEATIDPLLTSFPVTGVKPSRSYQYRLTAQNAIGVSEKSDASNVVDLPEEPPDLPPQSLRASASSTSSIMVEFAEPPYESWNGPLLGYIVQWRMEGYNTAFQYHNITNYRQTSYEIAGLITWKIYEIQVAAYNGAGVGAFTNTIEVRTNEGVPTAPPQDVDITVTSSTSFMYIFSSPPVQFINGINQGYKLLAWEPGMEANPITELVAPNIAQSRFIGNITTLKKYTQYQASVLCYTNPGDGVPSAPVTLTTQEDVPGPVSNLGLSNVYDTSLDVSWEQPLEVNGILTGYSISWQEHNKTSNIYNANRTPLETSYTIINLTSQTTYLIQVWAKTSVGGGPTTDIIISSGVPPERPQPPTNLIVPDATIQSRSVQLHFTPGFDGDAGITLWTVQAVVGQADNEWETVFELSDPSARYIEVTGLEPYTYYRFRMVASNVAGSSNASEPSDEVKTKQDVPAIAPRDVRVRAFNATALRVTWMPLDDMEWNGVPGGYHIYWTLSGSQAQEMTFDLASPYINNHIIGDLEEWMSYDVRIEAYNEEHGGPTSGRVAGLTNEAAPSAGPANIQALPIYYSQIMVTWGDVPAIDQNGEILGFKVIFREEGSILMYMDVPGNTTRETTITGLKGYTVYTITVLAYTVVGDGTIGNEVPVRTHEWTPSPPVGITFPTVQLSSVTITWNQPLIPNGPSLNYKVGHRLQDGPVSSLEELDVGTATTHTVTGLQPQETYYFEVTAKTSMGYGAPASALVITTTNRTTPEAPSKPTVDHIESRQVRLSWTPGDSGNSPLRYYVIDVKVDSGPWAEHSTTIDASQVSYTVTGLNPYTLYYFRLKVYNDIGASPESPSSNQITTEQDIPEGVPTITGATPITVTSLLVTWRPPLQAQTNGPLTGYRFQFRQLPGSSFMEETINDAGVTEHELVNLVRYQNYEVKIAATNSKGLGPYGAPVFVYIGEAVPSEPPSAVGVVPGGSTSFQISWTPPSMASQNGGLQGYKVLYWENHSRQARSTLVQHTKTFSASTTVAVLDNLQCFTEYGISVKGFNAAGDGPGSPTEYSTTAEDVPSEVSHVEFNQVRMTSLNVSWGPPTSACGVVTQYKLFYQPHQPINGERTSIVVTLPSDQYSYNAKRLGERERYLFEVHAETANHVGLEKGQNITTGPQEGAPDAPTNVRLSTQSSSVTVSWVEPVFHGDQPLIGYIIQSREKGQDNWEDINDTIPAGQSRFSIPHSSLDPVTVYVFRVMSESMISVSEPAISEELMVPAGGTNEAQKNFYEEWWFLVIVALVGTIVIILVGATLCMLGRSRLYVDKKVHKRMTPDERVSVTEDGGFTSFEMDPAARRSGRNGRTNGRSGVYARTNSYTRPPPRPSPGSIQYSEEEESKHYEDVRRRMAAGEEPGENSSLTEKNDLQSLSESLASESDMEVDGAGGAQGGAGPPSFVNHYASLPGPQSWRHQNPPLSGPSSQAYSYTDSEPDPVPTVDGRTVYLQNNLAKMQPGSRAPVHGFSSFV